MDCLQIKWFKTIKNALSNYISYDVITCDDRDPPRINKTIKRLIHQKNDVYQCFIKSSKKVTCLRTFDFYKHRSFD